MVLFKRLKTRAHNFILNRKLKKVQSQHRVFSYTNASSLALLFDASKPENMEPVKKYHQQLRNLNKKVYLLCYIHKERPGESLVFDYLTRRNLNWCFVPEEGKTNDFINQRFDLLINLCTEECLPLEYLSALSNSIYRVGRFIPDKTFCFDLMIQMNEKKDVNYLIEQVEHYLKMIN
jgi:hypothetical protein